MRAVDRLLAALRSAGNGMTVADLADWTDSTPERVRALIAYHREAFRVEAWVREPRHLTAVWGLADGRPDAVKPRKLTGREKQARYRKKNPALLAAKAPRAPRAHPFGGLL